MPEFDHLTDQDKAWAKALPPELKVEIVEAMGFTRMGDDHDVDCAATIARGNRCTCVPPVDWFCVPADVARMWGQTWDERLARARGLEGKRS